MVYATYRKISENFVVSDIQVATFSFLLNGRRSIFQRVLYLGAGVNNLNGIDLPSFKMFPHWDFRITTQ